MKGSQKMPQVTVVLTNYRRPANIPRIVDALRGQTVEPVVWMVDNAPMQHPINPMLDRVMICPFGSTSWGRVLLACFADTEWVALWADDWCPRDGKFLEDALEVAKVRPEAITGIAGRRFSVTPPHYGEKASGDVEIVVGHVMIFRKKLLERVRLYREEIHATSDLRLRSDDLYLSLEIGRGKPIHWADPSLRSRLEDLPHGGAAMSLEPGHFKAREAICQAYSKILAVEA